MKQKYVYFLSNNKKPNLKFFMTTDKVITVYTSREAARAAKTALATKGYKIFQVSCESVR